MGWGRTSPSRAKIGRDLHFIGAGGGGGKDEEKTQTSGKKLPEKINGRLTDCPSSASHLLSSLLASPFPSQEVLSPSSVAEETAQWIQF